MNIYGYYSGQTFLNMIGLSQQVPAVLEITTNNTSCKRLYCSDGYNAIIRKGKTKIDRTNYRALQFFDMLSSSLSDEEIRTNKEFLKKYIHKHLIKKDFIENAKFYSTRVIKLIIEEGLIDAFR